MMRSASLPVDAAGQIAADQRRLPFLRLVVLYV
jgi:hypothetical protein